LYSFKAGNSDVGSPQGSLALIGDTIYGVGASGNYGIFSYNLDTQTEALARELGDAGPNGSITSHNGILYGMTWGTDSPTGAGRVFSLDPGTGAFTTLHAFKATDADRDAAWGAGL